MSASRPPLWIALRAHFAADRRKTAVLVLLSVALAAVYARLFWGSPASAEAGAVAPQPTTAASPLESRTSAAPAPARIKPNRPLIRDLIRDPFAVQLDRFPKDPTAVTAPPVARAVPNVPGARREMPSTADQPEFRLQSTICGTLPMAWINGRCIQPGEAIDGFVLEQVEPARVVLRRGSDVRTLSME